MSVQTIMAQLWLIFIVLIYRHQYFYFIFFNEKKVQREAEYLVQ